MFVLVTCSPALKDISDFTTTRLNPTLAASDFLRSRAHQFPDNVSTKAIANSYLFMMEGSVEPRSMPMDALYLDEVDLCNPDHVGTAVNRLDASNWKIITYLSTPTLPNTGIDAAFQNSDQREWVVSCPHCDHKQIMDWDRHLRLRGPSSDPERSGLPVRSVKGILTVQDMQDGAWIPQVPSKSKDLVGYHISQIYTTPAGSSTATTVTRTRPLPSSTASVSVGLTRWPVVLSTAMISSSTASIEPYAMELMHDGDSTYYMGCDQGNQLQLVIAKVPKGKSNPKIVYIELVPFEKGFDRVAELMQVFKIKRAVIDGDPNRHPVKKLQEQFPGRVLMADYIEQTGSHYGQEE